MSQQTIEKKQNRIIAVLSIIIPLAVAGLFTIRIPGVERLGFLPPIYATTNAITSVLLVFAVIQIKKGNKVVHEKAIKAAMILSVLFLLLYVAYHATADATKFGDLNSNGILDASEKAAVGATAYFYYFLLATHILLSIVVIPFVLVTYVRAANGKFEQHKKIAKYTFPLWLYVAATGVVVYLMISPYYPVS
ncbi:DUF420 domain-containing protein [Aquimarina agarivorans]|uniref:DUF420 domain-containing protein n=1 Tax=Aquimarina agarivorans TaxID=980584 RepID=UPI000248ED1D|nr:DUF420 domain-containing protein [Aquimarina agarivorans]